MDKSKWEYKKWENVLDIINGRDYKSVVDPNGIYPICGSGGIMGHANSYLCPENSVIIGRKGNINHPIFMNEKYWNVDTAFGLVAKEGILLPKFLFYFCDWYDFEKHNKAVTIPSLTKRDLLKIQIQIPTITDQQSIVSELDQLNELISLKQEQLKEYDALAQSIFYEMFGDPMNNEKGWELVFLKNVSKTKLSYGSGASAIDYNGKVRYIRITDIDADGNLLGKKASPNKVDGKYMLNDGDILFARSGATVGKTYMYKDKEGKAIYAGYLIRLVPDKEIILPTYLFYYTKTQYYLDFVEKSQRAVAQPNINAQQYSQFLIPLPPLSLQHSFATKVRAIEAQKDLLKQSIGELQTLLASRMQEYFA